MAQRLTDTIAKQQSLSGRAEPTIASYQRVLAVGHGRRESGAAPPAKMKSGGTPGEIFALDLPGFLSNGRSYVLQTLVSRLANRSYQDPLRYDVIRYS